MAKAADFSVFSVLVTGSNQGIGLGLVKRFLELPRPPKWVFATSRDLEGEKSKAFLPLLKKAARRSPLLSTSKAAIINISSSAASVELVAYWNVGPSIAYRCSKAALNMLTKCQSLDYSANGIMSIQLDSAALLR